MMARSGVGCSCVFHPVGGSVMIERAGPGADGGFRVLDGVALVTGASVASVHMRPLIRDGMTTFGLVLAWGVFSWIALTAAGPSVFLFRRYVLRVAGYPRVGDGLWALLGLPWLVTALIRSFTGDHPPHRHELVTTALNAGLAVASLTALAVVWGTWVTVPPEVAARTAAPTWTNRVGLVLAIAWPVQCGLGMVVVS